MCSLAAVTNFLRKLRTPAIIDSMIPGSASLARALSLAFTHSLSLLGFFGGVVPPPLLPPPVSAVIMVEIRRTTLVKKAVMVPCRAL